MTEIPGGTMTVSNERLDAGIYQSRFDALYMPEPNSGCWLWMGAANDSGYGNFKVKRKIVTASRASWLLHKGDIPGGLWVLHKCDNPICVNPDHLYLGDRMQNARDAVERGRTSSRGSVLTSDDVGQIRTLLTTGESQKNIAKRFGVTACTVRSIKAGRSWKSEESLNG